MHAVTPAMRVNATTEAAFLKTTLFRRLGCVFPHRNSSPAADSWGRVFRHIPRLREALRVGGLLLRLLPCEARFHFLPARHFLLRVPYRFERRKLVAPAGDQVRPEHDLGIFRNIRPAAIETSLDIAIEDDGSQLARR
jgi:hypothetical protein